MFVLTVDYVSINALDQSHEFSFEGLFETTQAIFDYILEHPLGSRNASNAIRVGYRIRESESGAIGV